METEEKTQPLWPETPTWHGATQEEIKGLVEGSIKTDGLQTDIPEGYRRWPEFLWQATIKYFGEYTFVRKWRIWEDDTGHRVFTNIGCFWFKTDLIKENIGPNWKNSHGEHRVL